MFPEFFSSCSLEQLAEFMERAQPSCLTKPSSSVKIIAVEPLCGNALLDPGEECDCGTVEVKLSEEAGGTSYFWSFGKFGFVSFDEGGRRFGFCLSGLVWFPVCEVNKREGSGDSAEPHKLK